MILLDKAVRNAAAHGRSELDRVDYLDGWRGLAISLVLISHFYPVNGLNLGRFGVDIFFVLSGMLMSNILYVKRVPLSTFYKRRFSRVFPVFLVFLSLICLASVVFKLSAEHQNYLYSLLFLRGYFPVSPDLWNTGLPIGHIWSLNVEEHCYLLLSLLTFLPWVKTREHWVLFALGAASIFLNYLYITQPSIAPPNYHLRSEIIANHLLVSAAYFLVKKPIEAHVPAWLPPLTLALAAGCYSAAAPWYATWLLSPLLLAFTVNHLGRIPALVKAALAYTPLRLLGIWSFSIYLWQQPYFFYKDAFASHLTTMTGAVLIFASICTGIISFYLLENPVRRYLNNRW